MCHQAPQNDFEVGILILTNLHLKKSTEVIEIMGAGGCIHIVIQCISA